MTKFYGFQFECFRVLDFDPYPLGGRGRPILTTIKTRALLCEHAAASRCLPFSQAADCLIPNDLFRVKSTDVFCG